MTTQPPRDDDHDNVADSRTDPDDILALAEEAEADAEAALAEARARAARARADRLRVQAAGDADVDTAIDMTNADEIGAENVAGDTPSVTARSAKRFRGRLVALGAATVLLGMLLGLSGFMVWKDHAADQTRLREAEAGAVARQGVVNIMSLDFTNAEGDVQRVLDSATGKFKTDFESESEFLIQALEESKVVTEVTVNGVAVESLNENSAVVLVSAQSQASNDRDNRRAPQQFRVSVGLAREDGALKMSQVDFI